MPKFSIIIPVYNVEKYIKKCLDSVINQTYTDYEIILINDGSTDNSLKVIEDYDIKKISQKNQGLSAARNRGVKESQGEYILFLDSDDYIEKDLLKKLSQSLENNPDIVRFQIQEVYEENNQKKIWHEEEFVGKTGPEAFKIISKYHFVENAWAYIFKTSFYKKNNFSFKEGTIHEDFGLIPLVIMKAECVNSISYVGYNYLQRQGSIMGVKNYQDTKIKVQDFYNHYKYLNQEIDKTNLDSKIFKSFISNCLIIKICELKGNDYKEYKIKLRKEKVINNILANTFPRKIKKLLFLISPKITKKLLK